MKVYLCWRGSYSDLGLAAIFSTKEKAQAYLDIRAMIDPYGEYHAEPEEREVDALSTTAPETVTWAVRFRLKDKDTEAWMIGDAGKRDGPLKNRAMIIYFVEVGFNKDIAVMKKAAIDKASAMLARDGGL